MKKTVVFILCLLLLCGCSKEAEDMHNSSSQGCDNECAYTPSPAQNSAEKADMSGYEGFSDEEHVFLVSDVKTMLEKMEKGETFVVYFGFTRCPWCIEAVPILNETAKEYGRTVDYVDTRSSEEIHSNIEIPDYDKLTEKVGEYFPLDDKEIPHLYTPFLFFIRDGKVVATHQGTLEGHDAHERQMTEAEKTELKALYQKYFELLK
ncbi:MAG: transporter accessory protein [Erysipelotrichaceae bacterium]|nr:transporter accessory protein [Erysipelotrichaceae bacterium]